MGFGSFLKRITTIPSHGVLSPLRKVFGSTPLDEIGAVVGGVVGGPGGAAAGAGLGSLAHGASFGSALGNAAKYGGAALAGGAALNVAGGSSVASALRPAANLVRGAVGVGSKVAGVAGRSGIGGAISNVAGTLGGNNGAENQLKALGLLGTAAGGYLSGRSADQQQDFTNDQVTYARERNAALDPQRQAVLNAILSRMGGAPLTGGGSSTGATPMAGGGAYAPPTTPQTVMSSNPTPLSMAPAPLSPSDATPGSTWSPPPFTPPPTYGSGVPGMTTQMPGSIGTDLTQGWDGMDQEHGGDPYDLFGRHRKPLTSMAY